MGAKIGPIHDDSLYAVRSRDLIQRVTGIRPEPASGDVFLRDAGFQSIQRLVLAEVNGGLVAGLFPGELKSTALFIYSDHRADAFVDAAQEGGWLVRGTPHIGFWQAPPRQRLYLDPRIDLEQYVALWEGPGYERIGGYSQEELERSVWPWLEEQGLATAEDGPVFGEFLVRLAKLKRQAHVRPGLYAKREWPREEIATWPTDQRAAEIRRAVNSVLGAIGEPRFPSG